MKCTTFLIKESLHLSCIRSADEFKKTTKLLSEKLLNHHHSVQEMDKVGFVVAIFSGNEKLRERPETAWPSKTINIEFFPIHLLALPKIMLLLMGAVYVVSGRSQNRSETLETMLAKSHAVGVVENERQTHRPSLQFKLEKV